jgi:hypothetical protein
MKLNALTKINTRFLSTVLQAASIVNFLIRRLVTEEVSITEVTQLRLLCEGEQVGPMLNTM